LNISGNNIISIRDLESLQMLQQFMAGDNKLDDMKELGHLLSSWKHLWRLELMGNALCHKSKYRDRIIVMSNSLGELHVQHTGAADRVSAAKIFPHSALSRADISLDMSKP
jgi:Leucine-rich repeat (LRR) protein